MIANRSNDATTPRISRRAALHTWVTRAVPMLLAACAGPTASAQTTTAPARNGQAGAAQTAAKQDAAAQPSCVLTPQQTEGP